MGGQTAPSPDCTLGSSICRRACGRSARGGMRAFEGEGVGVDYGSAVAGYGRAGVVVGGRDWQWGWWVGPGAGERHGSQQDIVWLDKVLVQVGGSGVGVLARRRRGRQ